MKSNIELHVHPFLGRNRIIDIVQAMDRRSLDILAMEALDNSLFPFVVEKTRRVYPDAICDNSGIKLPDGKYFLNAREYNTQEGLHLLIVGYSMDEAAPQTEIRKIIDKGLAHEALIILDHPFVDNGKTKTAGHISAKLEWELERICKEYPGEITLEWNSYCIPWMRQVLKQGLKSFGFDISYHDVNEKAEALSERLNRESYNVPLVADTDLHARTRRHLQKMGTARIIMDIQGETPKEVLDSMIKNIFSGNYENIKRYVSALHLLDAFCVPVLFPSYFYKPRA